MTMITIIVLLLISYQSLVYTKDLVTQKLTVATWSESRQLCELVGEDILCNYSSGYCDVMLTQKDTRDIFSYPLWIDGFVSRSPWISQIGCSEVKKDILPIHQTKTFKLSNKQDITECVSLCGDSQTGRYGLYNSFCYCLKNFNRTFTNLKNCRHICHVNSTDFDCKNSTDIQNTAFLTEYMNKKVSENSVPSPWRSCAVINPVHNRLQIEDCRKAFPFICTSGSADNKAFHIDETSMTWYEAKEFCINSDLMLLNTVPLEDEIKRRLISDRYYWTGFFRPIRWTWDEGDMGMYGQSDCLVLNMTENGTFDIESLSCSAEGISGLCIMVQRGNSSLNSSFIPHFEETSSKNKDDDNNINTVQSLRVSVSMMRIQFRNVSIHHVGICFHHQYDSAGELNITESTLHPVISIFIQKIYIGVGIGVGIVVLSVAVVACIYTRKRLNKQFFKINYNENSMKNTVHTDIAPHEPGDALPISGSHIDCMEEAKDPEESKYADKLSETKDNVLSTKTSDHKQVVNVTIEPSPTHNKKSKAKSNQSKKKYTRHSKDLEISDFIEDESVTIVDDGTCDFQLSQNV